MTQHNNKLYIYTCLPGLRTSPDLTTAEHQDAKQKWRSERLMLLYRDIRLG